MHLFLLGWTGLEIHCYQEVLKPPVPMFHSMSPLSVLCVHVCSPQPVMSLSLSPMG